MAAKKGQITIRMQSTESAYYYTTTKPKGITKKLELMHYDPYLRKHVLFKEEKIRK